MISALAFADGGDNIVLNKKISANDDGTFDITLEAYATGSTTTTQTTTTRPVDLVLVLDVSGSMTGTVSTSGYTPQKSASYSYNGIGNNTLYYKDDKGNYYQVHRESTLNSDKNYYLSFQTRLSGAQYLTGNSYQNTKPNTYTRNTDVIYTGTLYETDEGDNSVQGEWTYNSVKNYGKTLYARYSAFNNSYYYQVSAVEEQTSYYDLYYNDENGNKHYLVNRSVSEVQPTNITANNSTIWTGVLYKSGGGNASKITLLNAAVDEFIRSVYNNRPNVAGKDHNIGIVTFSPAGSQRHNHTGGNGELDRRDGSWYGSKIVTDFLGVSQNKETLLGYDFSASGATIIASGLDDALYLFNNKNYPADSDVSKVVVMFTDGEPGLDGWDSNCANQAIAVAKQLKDKGVTIYTVGLFGSNAGGNDTNVGKFMNYVSSNYPTAENMSTPHDKADGNYYQRSNGSDLSSIFSSIASNETHGGEVVELTQESTSVVDIVSANFKIPSVEGSRHIEVWVEECVGYDNNKKEYLFSNNKTDSYWYTDKRNSPADPQTAPVPAPVAVVDGQRLSVTGFNFGLPDGQDSNGNTIWTSSNEVQTPGNIVGPRTLKKNGTTYTKYYGNKLVIKFTVELNPDYEGGYQMPSNDISSGIYVPGQDEPVARFPVPDWDFPSICILKEGMAVGESAIFTLSVKENGEYVQTHRIMLTQRKSGQGNLLPCYVVIKNVTGNRSYKVEEDTNWSWTYENAEGYTSSITQTLCTPEEIGTSKDGIWRSNNQVIVNGQLVGNIVTGKDSSNNDVKLILLNVDESSPAASGAICLFFHFKNEKKDGLIANAEDSQRNIFQGGNAAGGTEEGGQGGEISF